MIGLEYEAQVLAPYLGQLLGQRAGDGLPVDAHRSARRRQHASEHRQQRGLAAARWPHEQRELAARERQAYPLEGLDAAGALAEEFDDVDGLEDRRVIA